MNTLPQTRSHSVPDSLHALLDHLVDYAGLFPPASLDMVQAVSNYGRYLDGEHSWMLARFVVPASRLTEFERVRASLLASEQWNADAGPVPLPEGEAPYGEVVAPETRTSGAAPFPERNALRSPAGQGDTQREWKLSALLGTDPATDIEAIAEFNLRNAGRARVESVEIRAANERVIKLVDSLLPAETTPYFEIAPDLAPELIPAIREIGGRAKIRTGGVSADAIPTAVALVSFIAECARAHVPFKATAGLHHPLRCVKPLTYEEDAPRAMMHGFLNVFLIAALYFASQDNNPYLETHFAPAILGSTSPVLEFTDEAVVVGPAVSSAEAEQQPLVRIPTAEIGRARRDFAISFGSCSFEEPIADLQQLHLL